MKTVAALSILGLASANAIFKPTDKDCTTLVTIIRENHTEYEFVEAFEKYIRDQVPEFGFPVEVNLKYGIDAIYEIGDACYQMGHEFN